MNRSILLITVDCLRADHIGSYGYYRDTTPQIDKLTDKGKKFSYAFSNGPGTRFGFKSIHGGVHPLRIKGAGLPKKAGRTIAEVLKDQGYQTGGFSDNPFVSRYFNYHRGFDKFADYTQWISDESKLTSLTHLNRLVRQQIGPAIPNGQIYNLLKSGYDSLIKLVESTGANANSNDRTVVNHALEWISDARETDQPYFAWIHLMDAHHPYGYFPEHRRSLGISSNTEHIRMPSVEPGTTPPSPIVDTYDTNVRNADMNVGRILEEIDDDTTVILTADHGEELGHHNRFHKESVYQSIAHIPLVVKDPQIESREVDVGVSLVDLPPTIAHIGGGEYPDHWDGSDLRERSGGDDIFLGFENEEGVSSAVVRDRWKYICKTSSLSHSPIEEHLFNITNDPEERRDKISSEPAIQDKLLESRNEFIDLIRQNRLRAERELWNSNKNLSKAVTEHDETASRETMEKIDQRLKHLGYK